MGDIFVRLLQTPCGVNGMTIVDSNGDFNVYINPSLSYEGQRKTYAHEMSHISGEDFYSSESIDIIENKIV